MQVVAMTHTPPTGTGLYLVEQPGTFDQDGMPSLSSVWVFIYQGKLLAMPMGSNEGKPLESIPYLKGVRWSERLVPDYSEQAKAVARA